MKSIFLLTVVVVVLAVLPFDQIVVLAAPAQAPAFDLNTVSQVDQFKHVAAKLYTNLLVNQLVRHGQLQVERLPFLPEFEDPFSFPEVSFDLSELGEFVVGNFNHSGAEITGLSTIVDDLSIAILPPKITVNVQAPEVALGSGQYFLDALLNDSLPLTGGGNLEGAIRGFFASAEVGLLINFFTNKITVLSVSLDVGFQQLVVRAEAFAFDGAVIDWEWFDENAAALFEWIWSSVKADVELEVKVLLNDALKECTIIQLIIGDYSCIQLPAP